MLDFSDEQLEQLIKEIFNGSVDPKNLPEDLYNAVAEYLTKALYKGFGSSLDEVKFGTKDYDLIAELRENVYLFSSARTFQQTLEMSDALIDDDGKVRTFLEFKEKATEIHERYNGDGEDRGGNSSPGWIDSEYNTAILQGYNASKWDKIMKQKETLPYVRRVAVGDEAMCDICGELNGIVLRADDPEWEVIGGMSHFNCRCIDEQIELEEGEEEEWDKQEVDDAKEAANVPDDFRFNPFFDKEIFKSEGTGAHPYFSVPKEYRKFAEKNFNLDIPETDD
jgi:SPP1 gp7 family putative phage head morphogenesis protein